MRELRRHLHPAVATGRHRPLPVQRLRIVPQDERAEQTPHQAQKTTGESPLLNSFPSNSESKAPKYEHKADAGSTIPGKLYFPYDLPGIVLRSHPPMIPLHGPLQYCYYCHCSCSHYCWYF